MALGEDQLAAAIGDKLIDLADRGPNPQWTTGKPDRALVAELGHHNDWVLAAAVLPDRQALLADRTGGSWS